MYKYILKRLLSLIPILIGISFISFALIYFTGGDAVAVRYEAIGGVLSPELLNQSSLYGSIFHLVAWSNTGRYGNQLCIRQACF